MNHDQPYLDMLRHILDNGEKQLDRTGVGTISVFGYQMRFDLSKGFPLLTTKKIFTKAIIHELLWFLQGGTNIKYLQDNGVTIWDEWADENGDLGPVYGKQWTDWTGIITNSEFENIDNIAQYPDALDPHTMTIHINQIEELIKLIKKDPSSRRQIVTSWQPADIYRVKLPWCHCFFQTRVSNGKLSLQLYQRSCDSFLGVPFNIASYALLTHMIAQQCNLEVGDFIWTGGDVHIYTNHLKQVKQQLANEPYSAPSLSIKRKPDSMFDYRYEDFEFIDYKCHSTIKADVAV